MNVIASLEFELDYYDSAVNRFNYKTTRPHLRAGERETNKIPCNAKGDLKGRITAAFTNINKETVGNAHMRFPSRLEEMVEASGDFFE